MSHPDPRRWRRPQWTATLHGGWRLRVNGPRTVTGAAAGETAGSGPPDHCGGGETAGSGPLDHCAGGGPACSRIQACMAIPLATPALIDRVEPYWAIEKS